MLFSNIATVSPSTMLFIALIASATVLVVPSVQGRTFTVRNACKFTVWPAIFTDMSMSSVSPLYPTGWEAPANSSVSFTVPDNWKAGRIWARRDCDFTKGTGADTCVDAGCEGGLECDPQTGAPVPPVSVAEFTLPGTQDYYDVSLVNGFNLPIQITPSKQCSTSRCTVDLTATCPAALQGPFSSSGAVLGCKSACLVDPNPTNSSACCTGAFKTPATCPASKVPYFSFFKGNCPTATAYVYDENESPLGCPSSLQSDYTITFCP